MGTIRDRVTNWWTDYRVNATERAIWENAASLRDVGELTALWLEGRIAHQAGYTARVDVDEHYVPGLARLLAACCRAGFVTYQSQAAPTTDRRGWWEAYVEGFAEGRTARRLTDLGQRAGLTVEAFHPGSSAPYYPPRNIADEWVGYGICQESAVRELTASWQLKISDPEVGRNDRLWPALARFARRG